MLNPLEMIVLTKAIEEREAKAARSELLEETTYPVDLTVRIMGLLKVGKDYTTKPTVSVPLKSALALFIRYSGITRDAAKAVLTRAMTEALNESLSTSETVADAVNDDIAIVDDCLEQVAEMMGQLPRQPRKGVITTELEVIKQ